MKTLDSVGEMKRCSEQFAFQNSPIWKAERRTKKDANQTRGFAKTCVFDAASEVRAKTTCETNPNLPAVLSQHWAAAQAGSAFIRVHLRFHNEYEIKAKSKSGQS